MVTVVIIIAAVLIITAATLCYFAKKTFARGGSVYDISEVLKDKPTLLDRISDGKEEVRSMPFEYQTVTSFDGLRLIGKLYRTESETNKYIICMHGYRSSNDDFTCAMGFFMSQGYNILAVDQRSHGKSEGKWITFGVKERYDALSWCNYLIEKFGSDIKIISGKTGYEDIPTSCFVTAATDTETGRNYVCVQVGRIDSNQEKVTSKISTDDTRLMYQKYAIEKEETE